MLDYDYLLVGGGGAMGGQCFASWTPAVACCSQHERSGSGKPSQSCAMPPTCQFVSHPFPPPPPLLHLTPPTGGHPARPHRLSQPGGHADSCERGGAAGAGAGGGAPRQGRHPAGPGPGGSRHHGSHRQLGCALGGWAGCGCGGACTRMQKWVCGRMAPCCHCQKAGAKRERPNSSTTKPLQLRVCVPLPALPELQWRMWSGWCLPPTTPPKTPPQAAAASPGLSGAAQCRLWPADRPVCVRVWPHRREKQAIGGPGAGLDWTSRRWNLPTAVHAARGLQAAAGARRVRVHRRRQLRGDAGDSGGDAAVLRRPGGGCRLQKPSRITLTGVE